MSACNRIIIFKGLWSVEPPTLGIQVVGRKGVLNGYVDRAVEGYPLRGFDAIHLASAMVIHERFPEDFMFACFDDRLLRAANEEGFKTFPPSTAL